MAISLWWLPGAGFDPKTMKPIGYPYGSIPRLLLFWMNTEAVRTGKRRLDLGDTFSEFIRELGLDSRGGGPRSDYHRVSEQMKRLFSSAITLQQTGEEPGGDVTRPLVESQASRPGESVGSLAGLLAGQGLRRGERHHSYRDRARVTGGKAISRGAGPGGQSMTEWYTDLCTIPGDQESAGVEVRRRNRMIVFPAKFTQAKDGVTVSFPGIPEAITCGYSEAQAEEYAVDPLKIVLSEYIKQRSEIPRPKARAKGTRPIRVARTG
jgi:hypothetical protein